VRWREGEKEKEGMLSLEDATDEKENADKNS